MLERRTFLTFCAVTLLMPAVAFGHHGWSWTTGGNIELIGIIKEVSLGLPHGVLKIDADGEIWTVEAGHPDRNARAGLEDGVLTVGAEVKVIGEPSAQINDRVMKAEKIYLGDTLYNIYPNRD